MSKTVKPEVYQNFIEHLVDICRDGHRQVRVRRVPMGVRSSGLIADMRWIIRVICVISGVLLGAGNPQADVKQVYVIAESVSTQTEANRIIHKTGWNIVPIARAQYALVVIRSDDLGHSLLGPYKTLFELQRDARNQPNNAGVNFVVYLFAYSNLEWISIEMRFYPAKDRPQ
jgi:hypothetical protein